jgi:hypothetical protein
MLVPPGKPPLPARRAVAFPFCADALKFFNALSIQSREPRPVRGVIFARQPLRVMLAAAAADPLHQRAGRFCPLVFAADEADSTVFTI